MNNIEVPQDIAKAKSNERRAHLEAFRAAQAAKKAASLGQRSEQPDSAPTKSTKSRTTVRTKKDVMDKVSKPSASLSPELKSARASHPVHATRPSSAAISSTTQNLIPPRNPASKVPSKRKPTVSQQEAEAVKVSPWMEAQQAFGYETSRPDESRRPTQTGEPTSSATLGTGFGDDGDSNTGIRWQIQLERLRLQQWKIINRRLDSATKVQQQQAEEQLQMGADMIVTMLKKIHAIKVKQAQEFNFQMAAESLAAQMPRLELYTTLQAQHENSMDKVLSAVESALQQMPLVNGAICGSGDSVEAERLAQVLKEIKGLLEELEPGMRPFTTNEGAKGMWASTGDLYTTAHTIKDLGDIDGELCEYLKANAELISKIEKENLHAESLAIQLTLAGEVACK